MLYGRTAILAGSVFLCLLALEGWLRFTHRGIRTYLPPGAYQSHPTCRYTLKPNFTGRSLGVPFQFNAKGFRDLERSYEKGVGVFRILCIGDSVTFGPGLPFEKTYPQMLERRLNQRFPDRQIEVLNMSVPSYGTVYEARLLEEEGVRYHPDLVMFVYVYNDSGYSLPLTPAKIKWINAIKDFFRHLAMYEFLVEKTYVLRHMAEGLASGDPRDRRNEITYVFSEDYIGWQENKEAFGRIRELADRYRFSLVYLIYPKLESLEAYPFEFYHHQVGKALKEEPYVLDLLEFFRGKKASDLWVTSFDSHPNEEANVILCDAVEQFLLSRHLLNDR
ncbi:MAG: SGNH/GDSL hydrolase family protein [Candidatus Omnitrophota bacterium]